MKEKQFVKDRQTVLNYHYLSSKAIVGNEMRIHYMIGESQIEFGSFLLVFRSFNDLVLVFFLLAHDLHILYPFPSPKKYQIVQH